MMLWAGCAELALSAVGQAWLARRRRALRPPNQQRKLRKPYVAHNDPNSACRQCRIERFEAGKLRQQIPLGLNPPRGKYRCDMCGIKCRKSIYNTSWAHPLGQMRYALCDKCIHTQPDRDDWSMWMAFEIVR